MSNTEREKQQRKINYLSQVNRLRTYGAKEEPFQGIGANPIEVEIAIKANKYQNGEQKVVLLGQILTYTETVLRLSSKLGLKETHTYFSRQAINHWCSTIGVKPQIGRTNQGSHTQDPNSRTFNKKEGRGYDITCPLSIDEAAKLFCYLVRFKLGESTLKTPIEEYEDVAKALTLDFLNQSVPLQLFFLQELSLGEKFRKLKRGLFRSQQKLAPA